MNIGHQAINLVYYSYPFVQLSGLIGFSANLNYNRCPFHKKKVH